MDYSRRLCPGGIKPPAYPREPDSREAKNRPLMDLAEYTQRLAQQARAAARLLATAPTGQKNDWLRRAADALERNTANLIEANAQDVQLAQSHELTGAQVDRLRLTPA